MGNAGSDCSCDKAYGQPVRRLSLTQRTLHKLAAPPNRKCINEYLCKLEDQDIEGLETMVKMDEQITNELGLTVEDFEETWDNIKQTSKVLATLDVPVFKEERSKVKKTFKTSKCFKKKKEAADEYKASVKETLDKLSTKNGAKASSEQMSFKYC